MTGELLIFLLSIVAGVVGTALGGVFGVIFKNRGMKAMGGVLSFAGGVMLGIICFDMIHEAVELSVVNYKYWTGVVIALASTVGGVIAVFALNKLLDYLDGKRTEKQHNVHHNNAMILAQEAENTGEKVNMKRLIKAGTVMLIAITLHDFPEGMAIGSTGVTDLNRGILVAVLITLHNIPEGMAITAPLAAGGVKSWKAVLMTVVIGFSTILGAVVGLLIGGSSDLAAGVCMGIASGAMLYVTFGEILPEATQMNDGKVPKVSMLLGVICAMIFVFGFKAFGTI